MYLINYPPVGEYWNRFLIPTNLISTYIPSLLMVVCSCIILKEIFKPPNVDNNFSVQSACRHRRQSSLIICIYVILFIVLVIPSQVCRFYVFFNTETNSGAMWHQIFNGISYLYMPLSTSLIFILCTEIRQKTKMLFVQLFSVLFKKKYCL